MRRKAYTYWPAVVFFVVLLVAWEMGVKIGGVPSFILPAPSEIIGGLIRYSSELFGVHLLATVEEMLVGLLLSILLAVSLSVLMFFSPLFEKMFYPVLIVSQTVPLIAIAPVFALWFGYSLSSKVAVVVLISFFPLVVSLYDGLKSGDSEVVDLLRTFGANRVQIFWKAQVPMALPSFFSGLKVAAVFSVTGATIGEWLGAEQGLGYFGRRMSSALRADGVFASVLVLSLLGVLMFTVVYMWEKRMLKHK
ncbi:putative hydroxymethylpyrimidine transport system permease protein [Aneurinibacillus soli]|uniref:Putative aliphatic sulfonates transport permease protein SsuC n=1 Tax=Aneurinibacillus soli TaxID=1500254 RepID=A0A0U5AUB2_9BACL|nr:ABC transporter permease [Aneurinibacillus soli]PYE63738.1 putative hydroxymethylpyrimidine transport system permease protein [Aneurinibacillus soli]BAU27329.1 putative aliphatic sulfonates transport permease protein SsuC [Aneurinibacillus soli]